MKSIIKIAAAIILAAMLAALAGCDKNVTDEKSPEERWAEWLAEYHATYDESGHPRMDSILVEPDFAPVVGVPFRVSARAHFKNGYEKPVHYEVEYATRGPVEQTNINEFVCHSADSCEIMATYHYKDSVYYGSAAFAARIADSDTIIK